MCRKNSYLSIFIASLQLQIFLSEFVYSYKEKIGYIGPTCAVVGEDLYIHGSYVRRLNSSELEEFNLYQQRLGQFYDSPSNGSANSNPRRAYPTMLNFCNGLDDNVEVVLQGCTVRNNRVFVEDRLIRPLNALEREKINQVLATRIQTTLIFRKKRFTDNHEPSIMSHVPYMSQHDMTDILKQILNVNSTIAERFLPVVKMSPILSEVAASAENSTIELDDTPKEPNNTHENSAEQKMSQYSPTESGEEEHSERRRSPKRSDMSIESLTIPKPPNMTPNDATTDDINDPIIQKLIQSLTSGQHNAELAKQELTQKVGQHPPFYVLPPGIGSSLKPGDTTVIGGQTYVAVPLSMAFPNGNLPPNGNLQPPPTNFGSNQAQSFETPASPFNNNFHSMATRNSNFDNLMQNSNLPSMQPLPQNFGTLPMSNFPNTNNVNNVNIPHLNGNSFGLPMMNHYIPPSPELPSGMYHSGPSINTNPNPLPFSNFHSGQGLSSQIPLPPQPTQFNLPLNNVPLPSAPENSGSPHSIFIPFNNMQNLPDTLRYHPGKKESIPLAQRLPNEICTAHIVDPFYHKF